MKPYRKGNRWYARIRIDSETHYLGGFDSEADAIRFTQQVADRYPNRLLRGHGDVTLLRINRLGRHRYMARKTIDGTRRYLGVFDTRWAAERALNSL